MQCSIFQRKSSCLEPAVFQARLFCYFSSDNCTSGNEDLSTEAALQSFLSCNCDWRMPELADQLGNSRFCQQDQKTNLSEHCDIISFEFQVLGAQDFHLCVAVLHLFATPPTLFLRQQIKSSTKKPLREELGAGSCNPNPNFCCYNWFWTRSNNQSSICLDRAILWVSKAVPDKCPSLADRRRLTTALQQICLEPGTTWELQSKGPRQGGGRDPISFYPSGWRLFSKCCPENAAERNKNR